MSHVRMPFGKHKGMLLTELPDQYVAWLLTPPVELREPLKQFVIEEDVRRQRVREAHRARASVTEDVVIAAHELIRQGQRALTRTRHPDAGGSAEAMAAVNNAAELLRALLKELSGRHQ